MRSTRKIRLGWCWPALLSIAVACGGPEVKPTEAPLGSKDEGPKPPAVQVIKAASFPSAERTVLRHRGQATTSRPGVELLTVERHDAPVIFFRWVLPGGRGVEYSSGSSKQPTRWPEGTIDFTARMLTEGSVRHRGSAFSAALESLGGQLSVRVLDDAIVISGRVLSHQLEPYLGLLAEAITQPEMSRKAAESLRKRYVASLTNLERRPRKVAARLVNRLLYGDRDPYGSPGLTLDSVRKVKTSHMRAAFKRAFRVGGSTLVAVGDFEARRLGAILRKRFGRSLDGEPAPVKLSETKTKPASGCHVVNIPGAVQTALVHANLATPRSASDWPQMVLANQILGGSASSRLFSILRERLGLTYGVYSSFDARLRSGDWSMSTSVRTPKTAEATAAATLEVNVMRSTRVKAEELRNAKQFLAGQFVLSQASLSSVANRISALRLYDLPPDTWQRYVAALQAVTPLTVRAAAEARIGTAPQLIVMVGDLSKMRPEIDIHCPVLVEHDARGDTLAHLIGEDAEMTDEGRLALFESWASTPAGIAPLQRYVSEDNRKASYRARALRELLGGERQGQMLAIGAKARDWPDVAAALSQLLQADLLAKTKTAMSAKVVLLDLVTPAGQGKSPLDASQRDIAATAVAGYAFAGVSPASEPSAVAKAIKARLVKEDLNRLGPPAIEGLEALVACNVWRLASARSLLLIASAAATRALVSGYRRALVENGGLPMQVDLDLLGGFKHAQVVNLLLDAHGRLQSSKKADHPAATARTMATIRSLVSTMADTASREPNEHKGGRTVLERDFSQMQPGFERLLHQRNADDRWWATELLVRHRGMQGLRIAMDELADDDHYSKRQFHKRDPKRAVGELCRDEIAPLGNQSVRDVMLAYLHGHHRIAKVIAVTCLKAIGDEGAVDALKTYSDDTDISNSLGLPGPMPVSRLARAAVAVREYIAEVENAFRDGKMSRQVAAAHKESAYFTYALTGRRLRIEVSRQVRRKFGAKLTPSKSKRRKSKRSKSKTSKTSNRAKAAVKDAP